MELLNSVRNTKLFPYDFNYKKVKAYNRNKMLQIPCEIVEKPLFKYSSLVQDFCFLEGFFPRRAYIFISLFSLLFRHIILSPQNPVKPYNSLLFFLCYEPYSTKPTVC